MRATVGTLPAPVLLYPILPHTFRVGWTGYLQVKEVLVRCLTEQHIRLVELELFSFLVSYSVCASCMMS